MILIEDQASRISADGLIHDAQRLKELQALPLYRKVGKPIYCLLVSQVERRKYAETRLSELA